MGCVLSDYGVHVSMVQRVCCKVKGEVAPNLPQLMSLVDTELGILAGQVGGAGGTRTHDPRIMSPFRGCPPLYADVRLSAKPLKL